MESKQAEVLVPRLTCREVAAWASDYIDEHLLEPDKIRMALHLAVCAGCRTYVEQIAIVRDVVGLLPKSALDSDRLEQLRRAFAARRPH